MSGYEIGVNATVVDTLRSRLKAVRDLPEVLASSEGLDPVARGLRDAVGQVVEPGSDVNTLLSGTWLGHPLHPVLTDLTIGAWSSAVLVDIVGGRRGQKAADRLILLGLLSAAPTVASGWSDWSTIDSRAQRVGTVHAAGNAAAGTLFFLSYVSRKRGRRWRGRALALAGTAAMAGAGFLGGDLSFRRGAGVDRTFAEKLPGEWTAVAEEAALAEGRPMLVELDGAQVMLVRDGGVVHALAARCAHQGGPLHEGEVSDGCVRCPWHSSRFRLRDGEAMSGPTAHPQPVLQVRVHGGKVEIHK